MSNLAYHPTHLRAVEPEHLPDALCAYCHPAVCFAHFWDERGHACCNTCGMNANRVCLIPRFALREVA